MTRRVLLPSESEVRTALAELRTSNEDGIITARNLARQLGLANSTFWRHFPEIAQAVADENRVTSRAAQAAPAKAPRASDPNGALRKENATLRDQIELAVAHIQRLTIDNQTLRDQLEIQTNIVRLPKERQ